jgi:MFS family permease
VQLLGVLLDGGNFCTQPIAGTVVDHFGPNIVSLVAAVAGAIGHIAIAFAVGSDGDAETVFGAMCVGFLLVGCASAMGAVSALSTNAGNFVPAQRGTVIGLMLSGYGLSALLVSVLYGIVGASDRESLSLFFALLATWQGAAYAVSAFMLKRLELPDELEMNENEWVRRELETIEMNAIEGNPPDKAADPGTPQSADVREQLPLQPPEQLHDEAPVDRLLSVAELACVLGRSATYWLVFSTFALGAGVGLFVINNVGSIVESLGGDRSLTQWLVRALSVCNCLGRPAVGALSDSFNKWPHGTLVAALCTILAAAVLASAAIPEGSAMWLMLTVTCVGFAYGGMWAIMPICLSHKFGVTNLGKLFGFTALAPVFSSSVMNYVASNLYQLETPSGETMCEGAKCFASSYFFVFACGGVSVLLSIPLIFRTGR